MSPRLLLLRVVPMAFRKLSIKSRPLVHAPKKYTRQKMRKRVNSVFSIKYKILGVSAGTLAQTRFLFLVVISISVMLAMVPKSKNKDETIAKHSQGHLFLVLKKCTFFCGIYCRIILKSGSSNVFVLKIKVDFGLQNIVFFRYSNEKDNIQTGLLWTNGVIWIAKERDSP